MVGTRRVGAARIALGGLLLAGGVGGMHYTGMEAMRAAMAMEYLPPLVVLSIVVAYVLALAALVTRFALKRAALRVERASLVWFLSVVSAVTMGLAVAGMHYTAMAAVRFHPAPGMQQTGMPISRGWLAGGVAFMAVAIVAFTLLMAHVDRRVSKASHSASDAEARLRAIFATMSDAVVTFDERGLVESINPAAEALFRLKESWVGWVHVRELLPEIDAVGGGAGGTAAPVGDTRTIETTGQRVDGSTVPVEVALTRMELSGRSLHNAVVRDITTRKAGEAMVRRLATALDQASESVVMADVDGTVRYVNPAFLRSTGLAADEVVGSSTFRMVELLDAPGLAEEVEAVVGAGEVWSGRVRSRRRDGVLMEGDMTVSPVRDDAGSIISSVAVFRDVTERALLERQLQQAQKLEAIGSLAAGIAHEINTPTQYVGDNLHFLKGVFGDLEAPMRALLELASPPDGTASPLPASVREAVEAADIAFLLEEVPRSVSQSLEGVGRVAKIVRAMKEFSHPGADKRPCDLNRAIESTVTVATNEWKYVARVDLDLDEHLPPVPLLADEFNQVVLNMIVNAAHAIGEAQRDDPEREGVIRVSSRLDGACVEVRVEDNGVGIPHAVQPRVFEPFFTTKDVGKGTGQGLSIAHAVIVKKHGGGLTLESDPGQGATFVIRLPVGADEGPAATPVEGDARVA